MLMMTKMSATIQLSHARLIGWEALFGSLQKDYLVILCDFSKKLVTIKLQATLFRSLLPNFPPYKPAKYKAQAIPLQDIRGIN